MRRVFWKNFSWLKRIEYKTHTVDVAMELVHDNNLMKFWNTVEQFQWVWFPMWIAFGFIYKKNTQIQIKNMIEWMFKRVSLYFHFHFTNVYLNHWSLNLLFELNYRLFYLYVHNYSLLNVSYCINEFLPLDLLLLFSLGLKS